MKKLTITLVILLILVLALGAIACGGGGGQETPFTPTPQVGEFTLSDAPQLLDLSTLLPATFEHIDAASEGLSNEDLDLGPDCSEVEVFLSVDPYQLIYTFIFVTKSKIEKASSDALLRDDEQMKALLIENIQLGAEEEGIYDMSFADVRVTHPNIGNTAILGRGTMQTSGFSTGFDTLWFRENDTYVFLYSVYSPNERFESLIPIAEALDNQLVNWPE